MNTTTEACGDCEGNDGMSSSRDIGQSWEATPALLVISGGLK